MSKLRKTAKVSMVLVKRHLCIRYKEQRIFNLLTGSPCFPGSPTLPGFPEMPSAPGYPCMPFGPGRPGSPLVIKNYLDYREMLYRCLNDKHFYTYWGVGGYILKTLSQENFSCFLDSLIIYYLDTTDQVTVP